MLLLLDDYKMVNKKQPIKLEELSKEDLTRLEPLFQQAPYLSLNRENSLEWLNKYRFKLYALTENDTVLSAIGATRDYVLDYRDKNGEIESISGTYLSNFWTDRNYRRQGLGSYLFDEVINNEGSKDDLIAVISDKVLNRHPEWEYQLPSYYTERGFELIGHCKYHKGPVIRRKQNEN